MENGPSIRWQLEAVVFKSSSPAINLLPVGPVLEVYYLICFFVNVLRGSELPQV